MTFETFRKSKLLLLTWSISTFADSYYHDSNYNLGISVIQTLVIKDAKKSMFLKIWQTRDIKTLNTNQSFYVATPSSYECAASSAWWHRLAPAQCDRWQTCLIVDGRWYVHFCSFAAVPLGFSWSVEGSDVENSQEGLGKQIMIMYKHI